MNPGHAVACMYRKVDIAPAHTAEHTSKLLAEGGIAERIEERVQRGVEISDPRDRGHELRVDPVGAHGDHRETHEVRQEARVTPPVSVSRPAISPFHRFGIWLTIMTLVLLVVLLLTVI